MHNLATVEGIGASIGSHHSVEVSALLICHLFDRLRLGSSVIGDENNEMTVRSVHRQALRVFAKGILGLPGFENFSRGAQKLQYSCSPARADDARSRPAMAAAESFKKRCTLIKTHRGSEAHRDM